MPLSPGTRFGQYEVVDSLGAGGMGEVYRARDTKLGRSVAIKVLPDALAADADRIARFQREAKVLASLTHAGIAALYGMEEHDGRHVLVMELVEGETLAERLARGPLDEPVALQIARQIAEALEAAHERGIVHRDLKPANVKMTPDEKVKVLDFGLAKAVETTAASSNATNSPTLSMMASQAGLILGTAAYMSPEQAKGAPADHRSDVFSFGVVLFEMLTARQPFHGETAPEIMASVLVRDADLSLLAPNVHPRLRDVIARCLDKQPKKRWQAIGDVRLELDAIAHLPPTDASIRTGVSGIPRWKLAALAGVSLLIGAVASGVLTWYLTRPPTAVIVRFTLPLPDGQSFGGTGRPFLAISLDGATVAYVSSSASQSQIVVRLLSESSVRPIQSTLGTGPQSPFFSPDGQWIGFYSTVDGMLKKVPVAGGTPVTICAGTPFGVSWQGDSVLFGEAQRGILRVSSNGGEPEVLAAAGDETLYGPQMVAGGRAVIFTAVTKGLNADRWDNGRIVMQTIGSPDRTVLVQGGSDGRYLSTGHLVYAVGATLMALPFDLEHRRPTGGAVPVVEGVMRSSGLLTAAAQFAVASNGTLAFVPASPQSSPVRVAVIDRTGKTQPLDIPPAIYAQPRFSPDGKQLAVVIDDPKGPSIWVHSLSGAAPPRRLTFGGSSASPVWSPDGQYLAFGGTRNGQAGVFRQRADGSGSEEQLASAEAGTVVNPASWTPDGSRLLGGTGSGAAVSIWMIVLGEDRVIKPLSLGDSPGNKTAPAISPDGKWLAYGSNELTRSGYNVFVQPFPPTGAKYQVTTVMSSTPVWSHDGRQLLVAYRRDLFNIDVSPVAGFPFGPTKPLRADGNIMASNGAGLRNFDLAADGRVVVLLTESDKSNDGQSLERVNVVLNWSEALKQRVPTR
jgi:eukaryotic-like serine/threonine-protein kinase